MGYSWFRVEAAVASNPKVLAFENAIGDPNGLAYVTRLWCWAHVHAPSGSFPKAFTQSVETACRSILKPGQLVATMVLTGLLDTTRWTYEIHDWAEFQGKLVEKSKRDADLKKIKRAADKTNGATAARGGRAPGATAAPAPNLTLRDETRRDDLTNETPKGSIVDQTKPATGRSESRWFLVAEKLVTWMRAQRSLAGNFQPDRETDITAVDAWALDWVLKHEPNERAYDQMCSAFNSYLEDPWAIARDCALALWCSENVGLHRWTEERAKAAA